MKSTLLKAIIATAFIGIVIVIIASVVLNSNTEDRAFDDIMAQQNTVNFIDFNTKGKAVRNAYGGSYQGGSFVSGLADPYATHVCNAIALQQEAIQKNVGILKYTTGLSKAEKDNLVKLNKTYINRMKTAKDSLNSYFDIVNAPNISTNTVLQAQIPAFSADFVQKANKAYISGSSLYKNLIKIIRKNVYNNKQIKDYNQIIYEMANIYADNSTETINMRMEFRKEGRSESLLYGGGGFIPANNFNQIFTRRNTFSANEEISNSSLAAFIKSYNSINFNKLITSEAYFNSLKSTGKAHVNTVKTFLSNGSNFALNMSIIG